MQNVLFIISHDFGPRMGCYGDPHAVTPNLDRLAGEPGSVRFAAHYAQAPLCGPSRANIWTGCRPPTTQRFDNREFFPHFRARMGSDFATLPEHFKRHGYRSHGIWHLLHGFERDDLSWDEPCWQPALPTPQMPAWIPADQLDQFYWWVEAGSFALVQERMQAWQAAGHALDKPRRYRGPATEEVEGPDNIYVEGQATDRAVAWIEQQNGSTPFFLGVGYEIGHLPFCAPRRYWELYDRAQLSIPGAADRPPGTPAWVVGDREPAQYHWQHSYDRVWHPTYVEELALLHGHYAAMSYWDAQIGRLVAALERQGLRENTIVVVTTDHGFADGQHGYWGKHNLWEEALHVPLLVHAPGADAAIATPRLTEHVDLFPTLCELCGLPAPDFLEGTSLAPLFEDPVQPWKDAVFSWRRPMYHDLHKAYHEACSMRTERYRFTIYWDKAGEEQFVELFDYRCDPLATQNLALDPGQTELVQALRIRMESER